jgi:thiamine-phosphate pyrophosphorylase
MTSFRNLAEVLRLMLVTDDDLLAGRDPLAVARRAVAGGVTTVQLRLKSATPRQLCRLARQMVDALPVPVLVNDRLDVALAAGAAGVHLGPDDIPVTVARRIAPPGFLIGASVGTPGEVANGSGADYWGVGPWRSTATKQDAGVALGPAGVHAIVTHPEAPPCVAIGGVRPEDIPEIRALGAAGVAVVSGILGGEEVEGRAGRYRWSGSVSG